ncbi:MAG: ankyrin repeat domain-containing protein [Bacteriovoracaceae bacterium]
MTNVESIQINEDDKLDLSEFIKSSKEGSDPNAMSKGNTPLIRAAYTNQSAIFDFVLSCGAGPNTPNMRGEGPLMICSILGNENNVNLLLCFGAEPNDKDDSGRTPIMHAIMNQHLKVIQLLLNNGADLDLQDDFGMSALMYTIKYLSLENIKSLFNKEQVEQLKQQVKAYPEAVGEILKTRANNNVDEKISPSTQQKQESASTKVSERTGADETDPGQKVMAQDEARSDSIKIKSMPELKEESQLVGSQTISDQDEKTKKVVRSMSPDQTQDQWSTKSEGYQEEDNGNIKVKKLDSVDDNSNQALKVKSIDTKEKSESVETPKTIHKQVSEGGEDSSPEVVETEKEDELSLSVDEFKQMQSELENGIEKLGDFKEKIIDPKTIPEDKITPNEFKEILKENKKMAIEQTSSPAEQQEIEAANKISDEPQTKKEKDENRIAKKSEPLSQEDNTPQISEQKQSNSSSKNKEDLSNGPKHVVSENEDSNEPNLPDIKVKDTVSIKDIDEVKVTESTKVSNIFEKDKDLKNGLEAEQTTNPNNKFTISETEDSGPEDKRIKEVTQKLGDDNSVTVKGSETQAEEQSSTNAKYVVKGGDSKDDSNAKNLVKGDDGNEKEETQVVRGKRLSDDNDAKETISEKKSKKSDSDDEVNVDLDKSKLIPKEKVNEKNKRGQTHLMIAASKGDMDQIDLLLKSGAETSLKDFHGYNALMYATQTGHLKAVKVLAENTSELDVKTGKGYTALSLAVLKNRPKCITALVSAGARMDIQIHGEDILTVAISKNALESIKVLVALGLNPFEKTKKGRSAFDVAKKLKKKKIVAFLKSQVSKLVKKNDKG